MRDGYHIFGNGKSSKTTNKSQHHKFPSGLGYPKPEGRTKENLTHFFGHYQELELTLFLHIRAWDAHLREGTLFTNPCIHRQNKGVRIKTFV